MDVIEIRRGTQVLILARPGTLPATARAASDRQRLPTRLVGLAQDKAGMAILRAGWSKLLPTANVAALGDAQIVRQLLDALHARRIEAVLLRDPQIPLSPAELQQLQYSFANAAVQKGQIIVGQRGRLPAAAAAHLAPQQVVQMLSTMTDFDEGAVILDRQAGRLSAFGLGGLRGRALRQGIITGINRRMFDAAYIPPGPAAIAAGGHASANTPVSRMSYADKVGAALQRSLPHLSGEVAAAVAEMVTPTNLAIMAAVFVAVALANTNPVTGAAVDTILLGIAWFNAGLTGIRALGHFIDATADALQAKSEADLDAAGQTYAKALVGLGSSLIQAIMARFIAKKGAASEQAGKPAAASESAGSRPNASGAPPETPPPAQTQPAPAAKPKSLREQYMGRTPGKSSRTGQEVIERMRSEGTLRTNPRTGATTFKGSDGNWYPLKDADMAHRTDAVSWWNSTGRNFGAKAPEVRDFMLNSDNYVLDHYSLNRSAGAILGQTQTYLPPLKGP